MGRNEASLALLKARQAHLEWRAHAEQLVRGRELGDANAPVADSACEFGRWHSGEGKSCMGFLDHYALVGESHRVMHDVYRQLYDLVRQHNFTQAEEKLLELAEASDALLDSIELLEQELMSAPGC